MSSPPTPRAELTLALGILSAASGPTKTSTGGGKFERRRSVIRSTWLRFPNVNRSVVARFVLRCKGLDAPTLQRVRAENGSSSDVLCATVPASDGRMRGPVLALHFWLRYALVAFPRARFVGKADDDVYVHLPDAETHLLAIPAASSSRAYYGLITYFQLLVNADHYQSHSFGSTALFSRYKSSPGKHCSRSDTNRTDQRCFGPFPLACGPFFALGRGVLDALMLPERRKIVDADIAAIESLPPSPHRLLDDIWMGSILWRAIGGSAQIELFTMDPNGPLYSDDAARLRAWPSLVIWHNRLKFVNRILVLHAFHTARGGAHHQRRVIRWKRLKAHCCGHANLDGRSPEGRAHGTHPWPLWFAQPDGNASTMQQASRGARRRIQRPIDLTRTSRWTELGIELDPKSISLQEQA
jgi:hypothetical protein